MSAEWYKHNPPGVIQHLLKSDYDHETIAQIFGGDPESLIACALDIEKKYGFAWIELNMWCPSPKIMKCEAGSGMLRDKNKTLWILKEISQNISTPFSLKTRVWLHQDDVQDQFDFLIQASKYVYMIGIHGRTYKQSHAGEVNRDFIYRLKSEIPDTMIIGNGGLHSYQDCLDLRDSLDGMMVAQWAIGNPWVLTPHLPTPTQKYETIIKHLNLSVACELYYKKAVAQYEHEIWLIQPNLTDLEDLVQQIENGSLDVHECFAPVQFRKYLFRYIVWLPRSKELKKKIPQAREYKVLRELLDNYFKAL